MGYDKGFDISPPLSTDEDLEKWSMFMNRIEDEFEDDPLVGPESRGANNDIFGIVFRAGEHPFLPFDGRRFRRFSSKISGPRTSESEPYIVHVQGIAKEYFGTRIKPWNELSDSYGVYNGKEVRDALNGDN